VCKLRTGVRLGKGSVQQIMTSLYNPGRDCKENVSSIIASSLVAGEATCPQGCSLAMALVQWPVYKAVTWQ
jgi:hypothetical protein